MTISEKFARLGIHIPRIALPRKGTSLECWSVLACDQFTSQPEYWEETRRIAGSDPSTLNLIIPECYLNDNLDDRIASANSTMQNYIREKLFDIHPPGFILVDRSTAHTPSRRGIVMGIDLEAYSFEKKSKSLVRTTEDVIGNRLPARIAMRQNAALDLPHILLLIDDPGHTVMEAASAVAAKNPLYDFELMQGGGHVSGRFIEENAMTPLVQAFEALAVGSALFAVGDGNHSLAAAKTIWEDKKKSGASLKHPARYILTEVVNIHDPGLSFHPIHRVVFNTDTHDLVSFLKKELPISSLGQSSDNAEIQLVCQERKQMMDMNLPSGKLAVEAVQGVLDTYLSDHSKAEIDYIHGHKDACNMASENDSTLAILLPEIDKKNFFYRIINIGHFPRKSFSIGEGREKRYYLEARLLDKT